MRNSRSGVFFVALVTAASVASAVPRSVAATCTPRPMQPCTVDDFMKQAKEMRKSADYRPLYADDHVVARYKTGAVARAGLKARGARILSTIGRGDTVRVAVPKGQTAAAFAASLRRDPGVVYAERDAAARALGQVTEWGVADMHAPAAHTNGFTGSGVTVAVVDTGVDYNHQDLKDNIWTNPGEIPGNHIDDDGNGYVDDVHGYDFAGNFFTATQPDSDPMDGVGHGTHVAGIIAAEDNGLGVLGVAPDATIMPVKVLDNVGAGWDSTIADGIRYAVDNGADIINMSLGGYGPSGALADAVAYAGTNGVAVVAAAGNSFFYDFPSYPAAYPSVISVSAARSGDHAKTWWSDWGHADFIAPGLNILSTTPDNHYDRYSGTSMASPHVAGAIALIKQAHPSFTPVQLEQALAATSTDLSFPGTDEVTGAGFPDVDAATQALPDQVELYRGSYVIPADGATASTITLRILDPTGAGVPGVTGTFSTDKGALSSGAFITDGDGQATTDLTADGVWGSATVTATPTGYNPASVRVIIEDDRVRVDDITVTHAPDESDGGPGFAGEGNPTSPLLQPGDRVNVNAYLGRHNFSFEDAHVSFAFSVTDPNSDPVPDLSGTFESVTVPGFGSQSVVPSLTLTIPTDSVPGTYTITGTATTIKAGGNEDHTFVKTFIVGVAESEVLIVRSGFSFDEESLNFFWPHQYDSPVRRQIDALGRSYTYWDAFTNGPPSLDDLRAHSTVVWLGGWDADLPITTLAEYLSRGGNLLVSGELYGTFARYSGSATYRSFFHSIGLLTTYFPDDNMQIYPSSVSGASGGAFDGDTFDINAYNLNNRGIANSIFDEEHVLDPADGATALFTYGNGYYSPAVAGVSVDTGAYRVVNLGFSLESIDDQAQLRGVLDEVLSSFAPAPLIASVSPYSVTNAGTDTFEIDGDGFQPAGVSHVFFGTHEISDVFVAARNEIIGAVPPGLPVGTYTVKVLNPDGTYATKSNAVRVVYPIPLIRSISPTFASNDRARALVVNGLYLRPGVKIAVAGVTLPTTYLSSTRARATIPVGFTHFGLQDVRVTNVDGKWSRQVRALLVRYGFTSTLRSGARGGAVTHLQRRMKGYGYFPRSVRTTGVFGTLTRSAVLKYQTSRHLARTGIVDAATRAKLNNEAGMEIL